jgi:hypothetical protein
MFFWIREIAGWLLVGLSLYLLRIGLIYVADVDAPKLIEASIVMLAAMGVLRAGILLVRLSTTSRLALKGLSSKSS